METDAEINANQAAYDQAHASDNAQADNVDRADKAQADKFRADNADKAAQAKEDEFHANKGVAAEGLVGESGDPDVQYLIAVRDGLQQNRDLIDPPPSAARDAEIAGIDEKIAVVDKKLNDLGYKSPS